MSKIQVTLDATKLRTLVENRSYENKQGETVQVQEVKFELVPMKEENHKTIFEKDNFKIVKTHFAAAIQTKEEREAKKDSFYIGEGFSHIWGNNSESTSTSTSSDTPTAGDTDDELPF